MTKFKNTVVASGLLLAITVPARVHAQCGWASSAEILASASADIHLVGNVVVGTITCDGHLFTNIYTGDPTCRIYGDFLSPQGLYSQVPMDPSRPYYGLASPYYYDCSPVCGSRSTITSGFCQVIGPGFYEFLWKFPLYSPEIFYRKLIYLPPDSWDAPTCETCLDDSATACVHPSPRSLVVTPPPDLTLSSPLGDRTIERTYRTSLVGDPAAGDGMFGRGWRANFEYQVAAIGGDPTFGLMLFDAAGRKVLYLRRNYPSTPAVYDSPDGKGGVITRDLDATYLWQDANGVSYQFDATGAIVSIRDTHGNQQVFGRSGGRITTLTDRHGRVVTFDYQGTSHVTRLLGPPIAANPTGEYATYSYDASGNLTGVTYPDGGAEAYRYENPTRPNLMTAQSSGGARGPSGERLVRYDEQGRVQAVSSGPAGRSYRLAYGSQTEDIDPAHPGLGWKTTYVTAVTEWTDANMNLQIDSGETIVAQRTYHYESLGGAYVMTKVEDGGCSCAAEKVYDPAYHIVQSKDDRGAITRMTYNARGDRTSLTQAAGSTDEQSAVYDYLYADPPAFPGQVLEKITRQASVAAPGGVKVTTEVNDPTTGDLTIRREQGFRYDGSPVAVETRYTYTAAGALQSVDGPLPGPADLVVADYHPAGSPQAGMLWLVTEPNGAKTIFQEYDALGNLLRRTDANGRDASFAYNSRGLLQSQATVEGTTSYEYDAEQSIAQVTFPKGNTVTFAHLQAALSQVSDATGRLAYEYLQGNKRAERVYDAASVLQKSTLYEYDSHNRLWKTRQASGDLEELLYDENGNLTQRRLFAAGSLAAPSRTTIQVYDLLNRMTAVSVEGDPFHLAYGYDTQGNLRTVTDPVGQTTRFSYDDLGRREIVVSPETGTTHLAYDEAGNLTRRTDSLNRSTTYAYDGLGRITDIAHPDTAPAHFRYDDYSVGTFPDAAGKLTEVSDASGERRFHYNPAGRLSMALHAIDGREFATRYGYDANGKLTTLTYPDGRVVTYVRDPLSDRVQSVTSTKSGTTTVLADGITFKPFGPLAGLDYGNGAHLSRGYESLSYRLSTLAVTGLPGNPLPARGYAYDPTGNISGVTRESPSGQETHRYDYDLPGRLVGWTSPSRTQEFTYDANGNRMSLSDNGEFTGYSYAADARNLLAGASGARTLTYDADVLGNITGWGSRSLVYDGDGRLQRAAEGGVTVGEYAYNSEGQRAKKTAGGRTTYFEYDAGGRLIHEYREGDNESVDYVYLGDEPLAMLVSDGAPDSGLVVPLAGANGSLSPSTPQTVAYGSTTTFVVAPAIGYHVAQVSGCGGTLVGSTYTTGPVTGDCTVAATFAVDTYTVTPSAGASGALEPATPLAVATGQTATLTVRPDSGHHVTGVTGCGGLLSGTTYTTAPITGDCTVSATFAVDTFAVTPVAGAGGSLMPSTPLNVAFNQTASFAVQPNAGYHVVAVSGCAGTLAGSTYTTGAIKGDCTVAATFAVSTYLVTPVAGANGYVTPSTPLGVTYRQIVGFTVIPNAGYRIAAVTGCGGSLSGDTYTTGPVTADCTVNATFEVDAYALSVSKTGAGSGTVVSTPAGINCGATCSAMFRFGNVVDLTQTPAAGSVFGGWSGGGCSGTGLCSVAMTAAQTVTASYAKGITVTAPNGGEAWRRNTTYAIRWSYLGSPGTKVKVELLKAGVVNKTLSNGTTIGSGGIGSYSWKVPNNQAAGTDYRIRVTSTTAGSYTDTSDANFTIN